MFPDGIFAGIFQGRATEPSLGQRVVETHALERANATASEEAALAAANAQYTDLRVALGAALVGFTLGAWAEWRST